MQNTYVVTKKSIDGTTLFLVDRTKTRNKWWSRDLTAAMFFKNEYAACYSASQLKFGSIGVIPYETAVREVAHNDLLTAEVAVL